MCHLTSTRILLLESVSPFQLSQGFLISSYSTCGIVFLVTPAVILCLMSRKLCRTKLVVHISDFFTGHARANFVHLIGFPRRRCISRGPWTPPLQVSGRMDSLKEITLKLSKSQISTRKVILISIRWDPEVLEVLWPSLQAPPLCPQGCHLLDLSSHIYLAHQINNFFVATMELSSWHVHPPDSLLRSQSWSSFS